MLGAGAFVSAPLLCLVAVAGSVTANMSIGLKKDAPSGGDRGKGLVTVRNDLLDDGRYMSTMMSKTTIGVLILVCAGLIGSGQPAEGADGATTSEIIHAGLVAPGGVAADADGNVYVAGAFSNNAFKIAPDGAVIEIIDVAGDGLGNLLNGSSLFAPDPVGIAVDTGGNVYVTGSGSDNAFMVTPGGTITEIIDATGDGSGNDLDRPCGIAVRAGNVYVTGRDSDNAFRITAPYGAANAEPIIDASGDGIGNVCDDPSGVAVDSVGNVYVACTGSDNVFKITPAGAIEEIINGTGDAAGHGLDGPVGIAVDAADNVYVTGGNSHNAFKITPPYGAANAEQIIDATGDGIGNALANPFDVAVDSAGTAYVAGYGSNNAFRVAPPYGAANAEQIIDITGDHVLNFFSFPRAIASDAAGNTYVAGFGSHNAFRITPANDVSEIIDETGDGTGSLLDSPADIAVDNDGNAYVAGLLSSNAFRITPAGGVDEVINTTGDGVLNFLAGAGGIAANAAGNVYVTGLSSHNAFRIMLPFGAANAEQIVDATGDGAGNVLQQPRDVAADDAGNVFVTGELSDNAFKITPPYGAANAEQIIDANGDEVGNGLDGPSGIAVDTDGNVYVAGSESDNAFKITPAGDITEIIDSTGDDDGNICDGPTGVAVDCTGNAYVACSLSDNAFKITPAGVITVIIDATGDGVGNVCYRPTAIDVNCAGSVSLACMMSHNAFRVAPDCNGNAIPDECDLDCGSAGGSCDVSGCGQSDDANGDGIPDECQSLPQVLFVDDDASANGNGASWATAFTDLQDALAIATPGAEIWVAHGVYRPSDCDRGECTEAHRHETFQLVSGARVYGGFEGTESTLAERSGLFEQTVLSGDLRADDAYVMCGEDSECAGLGDICIEGECIIADRSSENSYHVVTGTGTDVTATLDGFTITGGNANNVFDSAGGGLYCGAGSNVTLRNCTFAKNSARSAGGLLNIGDTLIMANCTFRRNIALADQGGGMLNGGNSSVFDNCLFYRNHAPRSSGGGLCNFENVAAHGVTMNACVFEGNTGRFSGGMLSTVSNLILNECTFRSNGSSDSSGGMTVSGDNVTLTRCVFTENSGRTGGGLSISGDATVTSCSFVANSASVLGGGVEVFSGGVVLTQCEFRDNNASSGGGMAIGSLATPTLLKCMFRGNTAATGAGVSNSGAATLTNCTFIENAASGSGGGMYCIGHTTMLTYCLFSGNTAGFGGGMRCWGGSTTVRNCAFSGNAAIQGAGIHLRSGSTVLADCTFSRNTASVRGGALNNTSGTSPGSSPTITNCIFWADSPDEISNDDPSVDTPTISFSDLQGGLPPGTIDGGGNIDADPLFMDASGPDDIPGTDDDDLRLGPASPCIDAGDPAVVIVPGETDLDGHARVLCGRVDIGAYEFGVGDYDCDRDVDLLDYAIWEICVTGPDNGPLSAGCEAFDFDGDLDVDFADFRAFQDLFMGG